MRELDPSYYANARREIEPLLPSAIDSVLEIGCGEGNTLLWLRESKAATVCRGVEIVREAADRARQKGLDVRVADVEREGVPFAEQFQIVLCLDLLEHLRDPWATLRRIGGSIRPEGWLIASIPNIAHFSILSDLMFRDDWSYSEAGILDRTHFRFFTRRTARQLLSGAGLEVVRYQPRFARKTHRRLNVLTFGLLERFLTYQSLFLARKLP
ncbi:MAG TPA: class I SAM-dependent methyltransferase [Burkholderiales bacterium]